MRNMRRRPSASECRTAPIKAPPGKTLLAGVFHAVRRVDLADHAPILLVGDRHKAIFVLEFRLERGTFPLECEESFLDFGNKFWIEIIDVAVAGGRESF